MKLLHLKSINSIYFIGIKGVAMTALAVWAKEQGWEVGGSDVDEEFPTDVILKKHSIPYHKEFQPKNIPLDTDLVVVTGAHGGKTNIEAKYALAHGIPTVMQGEALGVFMKGKKGIAVAGSHGKTTTSAMIAHILIKYGLDPSFIVGCGTINSLHTPAHAGKGDWFVAEADEYINCPQTDKTPKFWFLNQEIAVITNIEFDHPDAYSDIGAMEKSFLQFVKKTKNGGFIVCCQDDRSIQNILENIKNLDLITYGFSPKSTFVIESVSTKKGKTHAIIKHSNEHILLVLSVFGSHNVLNGLAASIVANQIGIPWFDITKHLSTFTGTKRRFELICDKAIKLYDDYAHHPTEIQATLKAARMLYPHNRIIAIFQPHTYSRTKILFKEFSQSFSDASIVIIADIYASARESVDTTISSAQLVSEIKLNQPNCYYLPTKEHVVNYIDKSAQSGDIIITMGAGNIWTWLPDITRSL